MDKNNKYEQYMMYDLPIPYQQYEIFCDNKLVNKKENFNDVKLAQITLKNNLNLNYIPNLNQEIIYYDKLFSIKKTKDLNIYPIKMKDFIKFFQYVSCLTLDKNSILDPEIISMKYLEYLYYLTEKQKLPYLLLLDEIFRMSFNLPEDDIACKPEDRIIKFSYEGKKPFFSIFDNVYDYKDFDEFKHIICLYNKVELPDDSFDLAMRQIMDKDLEKRNQIAGHHKCSIEKQILQVAKGMGWSLEYIYNLSIRRFFMAAETIDAILHYEIYKSASMSGFVSFKDKNFPVHYSYERDEINKYESLLKNPDELQQEMNKDNTKIT